jgi:hypothetical protein
MRVFLIFTGLMIAMPQFALAQCRLCASTPGGPAVPSRTQKPDERPLTIEVEAALDFSRIARLGPHGGSVNVDPRTGARTVQGDLRDLGGGMLKGQVHVEGAPLRPIRVVLPDRVTLIAADGSMVEVTHLRTDLPPNAALGVDGTLSFAFGGQLDVPRGSAGDYHGRIPISVEYQ